MRDVGQLHGQEWNDVAGSRPESIISELAQLLVGYDLGFVVRGCQRAETPVASDKDLSNTLAFMGPRRLAIQEAEFSLEIYDWLTRAGLPTVGDVVACREEELTAYFGGRRILLSRLKRELLRHGVSSLGCPEPVRPLCLHLLRSIGDLRLSPRTAYLLDQSGH